MPATDFYRSGRTGITNPADHIEEVTPDDANDLNFVTRSLNVTGGGTVKVTMADGSVGTLYISDGGAKPVRVVRVWSTGTTATGIVGLS